MVDAKTIAAYSTIPILAALVISLFNGVTPNPTHYCDSTKQKAYCFSVSSTSKTCYTQPSSKGGKSCSEGWKAIQIIQEQQAVQSGAKSYTCPLAPKPCFEKIGG
jgi:hypothetical protein